jgi:hypothetical protein
MLTGASRESFTLQPTRTRRDRQMLTGASRESFTLQPTGTTVCCALAARLHHLQEPSRTCGVESLRLTALSVLRYASRQTPHLNEPRANQGDQ